MAPAFNPSDPVYARESLARASKQYRLAGDGPGGDDPGNIVRLNAIGQLRVLSAAEIGRILSVPPWTVYEWAADYQRWEARSRGAPAPEPWWPWHLDRGPELERGVLRGRCPRDTSREA